MKRINLSKVALAACLALGTYGIAAAKGELAVGDEIVVRSSYEGVAKAGSPVFEWLRGRGLSVSEFHPVAFRFVSTEGDAKVLFNQIISSAYNKNWELDSPLPSPGWSGAVGSTVEGNFCGVSVHNGTQTGYAQVEITWTMEYTTDTNNDQVPDADPVWVVSSITISNVEQHTSAPPMEC